MVQTELLRRSEEKLAAHAAAGTADAECRWEKVAFSNVIHRSQDSEEAEEWMEEYLADHPIGEYESVYLEQCRRCGAWLVIYED